MGIPGFLPPIPPGFHCHVSHDMQRLGVSPRNQAAPMQLLRPVGVAHTSRSFTRSFHGGSWVPAPTLTPKPTEGTLEASRAWLAARKAQQRALVARAEVEQKERRRRRHRRRAAAARAVQSTWRGHEARAQAYLLRQQADLERERRAREGGAQTIQMRVRYRAASRSKASHAALSIQASWRARRWRLERERVALFKSLEANLSMFDTMRIRLHDDSARAIQRAVRHWLRHRKQIMRVAEPASALRARDHADRAHAASTIQRRARSRSRLSHEPCEPPSLIPYPPPLEPTHMRRRSAGTVVPRAGGELALWPKPASARSRPPAALKAFRAGRVHSEATVPRQRHNSLPPFPIRPLA